MANNKMFYVIEGASLARSVEYDPDQKTLIVDYAKHDVEGEKANTPKRFRYLHVPERIFTLIVRVRTITEKAESPGAVILREVVGSRKAVIPPYPWEELSPTGEVVRRSNEFPKGTAL